MHPSTSPLKKPAVQHARPRQTGAECRHFVWARAIDTQLIGARLLVDVVRVQICGVDVCPARSFAVGEVDCHAGRQSGAVGLTRADRAHSVDAPSVDGVRVRQRSPRRRACCRTENILGRISRKYRTYGRHRIESRALCIARLGRRILEARLHTSGSPSKTISVSFHQDQGYLNFSIWRRTVVLCKFNVM